MKTIIKLLFTADKIIYICFCIMIVVGCQSTASKQPNLLAQEIELFDSLKSNEPWDTITRYVNNTDFNEAIIVGKKDWQPWDQPYEYALILDTRDSTHFSLIDTAYACQLSSTIYTLLPHKHIIRLIAFFRYIPIEDGGDVAFQKSYEFRNEDRTLRLISPP